MFPPRGRGWRGLCERCLIMIQRETRQQTALSSLTQLPRGGGAEEGGGLEIGRFVYWLITASLPNELYSCSLLKKKLIFISLRAVSVLSHAAVLTRIRRWWKEPHRDETGSLGEESVHLFKTECFFKEGQSFPAFLGLSFILGPVAQITWLL